jgi:uncharacterized membrane protein YedE/YeeE
MRAVSMLGAGLLFGVGLGLSGMTQPAKVIGFLDVFGRWDPSLMFVMGGALAVHFLYLRTTSGRTKPLLDTKFHLPTTTALDAKLFVGASIFGIGWGLGGFCPGPALVSAGSGGIAAIVCVAAMAAGMAIQHVLHAAKA